MQNFLGFLYQLRHLFLFLLLEAFCLAMMWNDWSYVSVRWFHAAQHLLGRLHEYRHQVEVYTSLRDINQRLVDENKALKQALWLQKTKPFTAPTDNTSSGPFLHRTTTASDSSIHYLVVAEVVNNTLGFQHNYLTLDKGRNEGILPGMGVVGIHGVVGKTKHVSKHFSTVYSLLNTDLFVSCLVKRDGTLGTFHWKGISPIEAELLYIPRHVPLYVGDTLLTSGFGNTFDRGIMLGEVSSVSLKAHENFYSAQVRLVTDFYHLHHVYVMINKQKQERDSLEHVTERSL